MHSAVALAAVGSVLDEVKGKLAKAYVILKPRALQFVGSVPTTSSVKSMRSMLVPQRLGSSANLTRANPSATLANKAFANLDRRENA